MNLSLLLLYDQKINKEDVNIVADALKKTYSINIIDKREYFLDSFAYNNSRKQYDGQKLLNNLIDEKKLSFFIWIVQDDLYVPVMNFVFGLATKYHGAIVSFFRIDDIEMKIKESIHECGHVFGLSHCTNYCVMQYSNTLKEAFQKPSYLCKKCKEILKKNI